MISGTYYVEVPDGAKVIGSSDFCANAALLIGDRVTVYQGVTLGAKSMPLDADGKPIKGIPRHPIVEDNVVIYSGATILGRVTIGKGSVIGGNIWLTRSVDPGSRISQAQPQEDAGDHRYRPQSWSLSPNTRKWGLSSDSLVL